MRANQAKHSVRLMCRLLEVSASGYYAWSKRPRSKRSQDDEELLVRIREIHQRSRATYGAPRVHAELMAEGHRVGRKRVARLMREAGLEGASRRRWFSTTVRSADRRPAPDLVERNFTAEGPNRLWVADITYMSVLVGVCVLGGGARRLEPPHRGLVDGTSSAH